ncbi:lysyl oxidase family protein [Sandaracinus amylolyticus]|nr:lysyl oxidase family protein [Sandaracinus amylolyticus]
MLVIGSRHALRFVVSIALLAACDAGRSADERDAGDRMDASQSRDAGRRPPPVDGGGACVPPAAPAPHEGCNPENGFECDGDYDARCNPACPDTHCCSPQAGRFECVERDEAGNCPAADLWVDEARIAPYFEYRYIGPSDCALVEGCVAEPGMRRLLRFDAWTPNTGDADLYLGVPTASSPNFEYSSCHRHFHFETYAAYELLDAEDDCVVAEGHKQAFCLLDYYTYPCDENDSNPDPEVPDCRRLSGYSCVNQGIRRGAQDVYEADVDCQWVDVTGLPPGDYRLRVRINTDHLLRESDYGNNEVIVGVTIPEDPGPPATDIGAPCEESELGLDRTCGFARSYDGECEPGSTVTLGCSAACGYGECSGDTILMVCEAAIGASCTSAAAIATNDASGCGVGACRGGTDCCSSATFECPTTGSYTVWTGAFNTSRSATCEIALAP